VHVYRETGSEKYTGSKASSENAEYWEHKSFRTCAKKKMGRRGVKVVVVVVVSPRVHPTRPDRRTTRWLSKDWHIASPPIV